MSRTEKLLQWLCDHNQEDTRVTLGCKTCNYSTNLMAATALTCWYHEHRDHETWIKSPFKKKVKS